MTSNELIQRYLLGIASDDEVHELESRLQVDAKLQDEFLLQAELDAHLRQEAQLGSPEDDQPQVVTRQSSSNVWKWVSGISTLAATILLTLLVLALPHRPAFASLGDLAVNVSWAEQNIWAAAGLGDLPSLRRELQNNVPVDVRLNDELTPLHLTALFNQKEAAEILLAEGADVSLTDHEGNTALHMAAFLSHTNVLRVLLSAGANPNIRNDLGFSPTDLVAVAWSSKLEEYYHDVEKVLSTSLDLAQIRAERPKILKLLSAANRGAGGATPTISIWQAAMTGNTAAVRQHIESGTDLNAKEDFGGSTPLILSAIFGHPEVAQILIDAGADLERRNHSGGTAIHLASFFCQPAVVEALLQAGADPNKTNHQDFTPLDVVTIDLDTELQAVYEYVYDSLDLELDLKHIKDTRLQVADILRGHQVDNGTTPKTERAR